MKDKRNIGRDMEYKRGPKNQWRRWAWREVKKRLSVPVKDAKVLYLAGKSDHDRAVAIALGFSPDNLYAVDNDAGVVRELRARGVNALHGDFFNFHAAGFDFFDVLFCDACSGWTSKVAGFVRSLIDLSCRKKVVVLNLQRGRDSLVNEMYKNDIVALMSGKSRAMMAFNLFCYELSFNVVEAACNMGIVQIETNVIPFFEKIYKGMNHSKRTYKNSRVLMDSVVFSVPKILSNESELKIKRIYCGCAETKNLSTAKAISTMRKAGKLKSSPRR